MNEHLLTIGVVTLLLLAPAQVLGQDGGKTLATDGAGVVVQMTCPAPGIDTDGDGQCDDVDADDDNDGMPDAFELEQGFDLLDAADALQDFDLDGAPNLVEFRLGTDPADSGESPSAERSTTTVASVLPLSRSASVGTTVTAFATLVNAGASNLTGCTITPGIPLAANFFFSATDAATNAAVGELNEPVAIAGNASQSFIFGFTPSAAFSAQDIPLQFACDNALPVAELPGINSLLLSSATVPVPDVVALAATAGTPGILTIPDISAPGAFSVASVNLGAADSVSVSAGAQNGSSLPISVTLCETNPADGSCVNPVVPATTVDVSITQNGTPTFSVFVSASDAIPLAPGSSRVAVTFRDSGGEIRGSTSVAIEAVAAPAAPTFTEVQAIFTQNCALSGCHNAASARAGMSLQASAFANIVGVPSSQVSGLNRITAGTADDSYIVRKLEGGPGILGSRMPLGGASLSAANIELIRTWIDAGAANN